MTVNITLTHFITIVLQTHTWVYVRIQHSLKLVRCVAVLCHTVAAFNYTGCADDFLAIIADGVEVGHTRRINVSVSVTIPTGTRVLGIRLVRCSIPRVICEKYSLQFSCQEDCLKQIHLVIVNV
jgi:hypothetical protein